MIPVGQKAKMATYELLPHQQATVAFAAGKRGMLDASDPGTGKTFAALTDWANRYRAGFSSGLLILAASSLMRSVWEAEIHKFFPRQFRAAVITAENRSELLTNQSHILITNTDAITWIAKHGVQPRIDSIIIDESDAFRHLSKRTQALMSLQQRFVYKRCLSGTPFSKSITELYYQVSFLDNYEHFGPSFYRFRQVVAEPRPIGNTGFTAWQDKQDAYELIATHLHDLVIRHRTEDCVQLPECTERRIEFELPRTIRLAYERLKRDAMLAVGDQEIVAVNAAILANKLLQLLSGTVYGLVEEEKDYARKPVFIYGLRYALALELAKEVEHSIIFFNWKHQLTELQKEAKSRSITYEYIDGSVSERRREEIVSAFQEGNYRTLFLHPVTCAHGLTLTRATRTIWTSPIYHPTLFTQGNRRINRIGQTKDTETLLIAASNTLESKVYDVLSGRLSAMQTMLELLS